MRRSNGFTLVELMVALAVAGFLVAMAAPSFESAINGSRLSGGVNELASALQLARAEAVRRNRRATLCRSENGSTCAAANGEWSNWIVFVDTDSSGQRDGTETIVKTGTLDSPLHVLPSASIAALTSRISFRGDGVARASDGLALLNGTLAVCVATAAPAQNVHELNIAFGSRTAVRRRDGGGTCSTPEDN